MNDVNLYFTNFKYLYVFDQWTFSYKNTTNLERMLHVTLFLINHKKHNAIQFHDIIIQTKACLSLNCYVQNIKLFNFFI